MQKDRPAANLANDVLVTIGKYQVADRIGSADCDTDCHVTGDDRRHRSDEQVVPEVPQVNIERLGHFKQNQNHVDDKQRGDHAQYEDAIRKRHGAHDGNAHVDRLESQPPELLELLNEWRHGLGNEARGERDALKADADDDTGACGVLDLHAKAQTHDEQDDRHHDKGAQADDRLDKVKDDFHVQPPFQA